MDRATWWAVRVVGAALLLVAVAFVPALDAACTGNFPDGTFNCGAGATLIVVALTIVALAFLASIVLRLVMRARERRARHEAARRL